MATETAFRFLCQMEAGLVARMLTVKFRIEATLRRHRAPSAATTLLFAKNT